MEEAQFTQMLDETLQRQLGYPNEQELIEILNKYEYQLDLEQSDVSERAVRGRQVRLLQEHLARRQGGKLDRFGLRDLSLIELQHRHGELKQEGEQYARELQAHIKAQQEQPESILGNIVGFVQNLSVAEEAQYKAFVWKKLLSEFELQIKLKSAPPSPPSPPRKLTPAEQVTNQKKAALKEIAELQTACEDTLKNTPDALKPDIKRAYQKEIDRIREEKL